MPIGLLRYKDITNARYGRLVALMYVGRNHYGSAKWLCKCDCGREIVTSTACLHGKKNHTRSCGCLQKERPPEYRDKIRKSLVGKELPYDTRLKISLANRGEKSYQWKGGESIARRRDRDKFEVREWRRKVFERDDYTCQECGDRGGKLNAHHIKTWAGNKEARFDIDNGITLCVGCHKEIHSMRKRRPSTIKQYLENRSFAP